MLLWNHPSERDVLITTYRLHAIWYRHSWPLDLSTHSKSFHAVNIPGWCFWYPADTATPSGQNVHLWHWLSIFPRIKSFNDPIVCPLTPPSGQIWHFHIVGSNACCDLHSRLIFHMGPRGRWQVEEWWGEEKEHRVSFPVQGCGYLIWWRLPSSSVPVCRTFLRSRCLKTDRNAHLSRTGMYIKNSRGW